MLLPLFQEKERHELDKLKSDWPDELPVLPLRNVVAFPHAILPLAIGVPRSVRLLEDVLENKRLVVLVAARDPTIEELAPDEIYPVGTLALIERALRVEGDYQILVRGLMRVRITQWLAVEPYLKARVEPFAEVAGDPTEMEALRRALLAAARNMLSFFPQIPEGIVDILDQVGDPSVLLYAIASNVRLKVEQAQEVLAGENLAAQMRTLLGIMQRELQVLQLSQKIREEAQGEMEKTQREYFLRQQLKAIQKELGECVEQSEVENYRRKVEEEGFPEEGGKEAERELDRLAQMNPQSAEAGVIKTYLDWLTELPWNKLSEDNLDLEHARQVLDEDHYGLEKVKERILEYLAVRKLRLERGVEEQEDERTTAILCFVGPPGVGKTSLGRSIARALGREFTGMSLGVVRDEA